MECMEHRRTQTVGEAALDWARDSVRSRGFFSSLSYLATQLWYLVRDSMPDRRRQRFGDIDYDCDFGVDTTWARLPLEVRLREVFTERLYQPTVPEEFSEIMRQLEAVDFEEYAFIDLGSGKGRTLLLAAMYPFREIIGVEVQPELHEIAVQNILRFNVPGQECGELEAFCMDAREFQFPDIPLVVYLFNPFPDYVLEQVLRNLEESVRRKSRSIYVIYNAPFEQQVFAKFDFCCRVTETPMYSIYRASAL